MAIIENTLYKGNQPYMFLWTYRRLWNVTIEVQVPQLKTTATLVYAAQRKEIFQVRARLKYLVLEGST